MKEKIIRINASFSVVFYLMMSFIAMLSYFIEDFEYYKLVTSVIFLIMSITGLLARNYGSVGFNVTKFSLVTAVFSLFFGFLFVLIFPYILYNVNEDKTDTLKAVITLVILFLPAVLSSLIIILYKSKKHYLMK